MTQDSQDYVVVTQEIFQNLITKPKLSEKYLRKPPFRFIHDIVTNTMKSTGFPEGLFQGDELNGKIIKDKHDKISWLNKLIKCIESVTNTKLNVKPPKVVAGLEPQFTNEMLQTFANIAINVANGQLTMENILNNMNNPNTDNNNENQTNDTNNTNTNDNNSENQTILNNNNNTKKISQQSIIDNHKINNESEDWIIETQQTLGSLIERPRLLEKLLKRPPFRFLHDIVKSLIKSTGYPLQFLDEDKDITNIDLQNAKSKYAFLSKLILIVSATIDQDLSFIDPKNIIAGRNAQDTNHLLTKLANAASIKQINVDHIKQKMNEMTSTQQKKKEEQKQPKDKEIAKKEEPKKQNNKPNINEKPASNGTNTARKAAPVMPKLQLDTLLQNASSEQAPKQKEPSQRAKPQPQPQPHPKQQDTQQPFQAVQKLQRPRTARRAPPKLKSNVIDEQKQNEIKNNIIIMDNNDGSGNNTFENDIDDIEDLDEIDNEINKQKRMNMNINNINTLSEEQELERLGFINNDNNDINMVSNNNNNNNDGNHGKLVRDILDAQSGIKLDTMRLGTHRKDSAKSVEKMENMREMIQKLCQTCLPLGKCIDLVFEDVESINNELLKWKQQIIKNKTKLIQEKEKTNQILNPLQKQIQDIKKQIQNQNQLILEKKAVLLRNEKKTNDIIRKRLLNE